MTRSGRELLTLARSAIAARFGQVVAAATASDPALTVRGHLRDIDPAGCRAAASAASAWRPLAEDVQ